MDSNLEYSANSEVREIHEPEPVPEPVVETEETSENYDDCALNEAQDGENIETDSETVSEADENYDDCAVGDGITSDNVELSEEDDDYSDCGKISAEQMTEQSENVQEEPVTQENIEESQINNQEEFKNDGVTEVNVDNDSLEKQDEPVRFEDLSYKDCQEMMKDDPGRLEALNNDYQERFSAEARGMTVDEYRDYVDRLRQSEMNEDTTDQAENTGFNSEITEEVNNQSPAFDSVQEHSEKELSEHEVKAENVSEEVQVESENIAESQDAYEETEITETSDAETEYEHDAIGKIEVVSNEADSYNELDVSKQEENLDVYQTEVSEINEETEFKMEENPEQNSLTLDERIESELGRDDITASEVDSLKEEHQNELNNKLDERTATEAEMKEKFEDVLSKEQGSDEYKQALQEYNSLHDTKLALDEQISSMEKQQVLLEEKSWELNENISENSDIALEAASETETINEISNKDVEFYDKTDDSVVKLYEDNISDSGEISENVSDNQEKSLKETLDSFEASKWNEIDVDDKKELCETLGDRISENLGIENKPGIEFYNNPNNSDYGYYSPEENKIYLNEHQLNDGKETADTIAHEARHCWQYERAADPQTEQDYAFKENIENYVDANVNFEQYCTQLIEVDARDYAADITKQIEDYSSLDISSFSADSSEYKGASFVELNPERGAVFDSNEAPDHSSDVHIGKFKIVDGKVDGKIPLEDYNRIREESVHNKDAKSMTLGKYDPTENPDGSKDYSNPLPSSYNIKAQSTGDMYFDLGTNWNVIIAEYNLSDGYMFEMFNIPALDDAISKGIEIRFSHNPEMVPETSALYKEWQYLLQNGYSKLEPDEKGEYWYARK